MEIGPDTEDLGVEEASDRAEFAKLLRTLHMRAVSPSLRALEKETATAARPLVPLRRSSLSEVLQGRRFPQRAVLATFLHTCGVQGAEAQRWMRAWERLAPAYAPATQPEAHAADQDHDAEAVLAQARRQAEQIRAQALQEAQRTPEQESPASVDYGPLTTMFSLGTLLQESRRSTDAEAWYSRRAMAGGTATSRAFGLLLRTETEEVPFASPNSLLLLLRASRAVRGEMLLRCAAKKGHTEAIYALGLMLHDTGWAEEAEPWLERAADNSSGLSSFVLVHLLDAAGRREEAEALLRRAAADGAPTASVWLSILLDTADQEGQQDEGMALLERAAEEDNVEAMYAHGLRLAYQDRGEEAKTWLERAVDNGYTAANDGLLLLLEALSHIFDFEEAQKPPT
ncbi:hypothetical protein O4J56_04495 [Nocardiopsis sp. RSe5-2]|uniref:Tetratricopeptide repeat protein n=1 Tax=Nocardiopsis endophytica TaxID=3018445 RepID=A0ABT4TYV9_9ACTN|nr:hypothetical protein [Nocardiopsis endophytica]MDA2809888.1 hypothetical protein [Nocardiopsis endophytica]